MKSFHVLLLAGLLLPVRFAGAAPKAASPAGTVTVAGLPVRVRGGAVIIGAGTDDAPAPLYNGDLAPVDLEKDSLTPFVAVLKAYPNARTVKLSWFELVTMSGTGADVLYDRVKHTVTVDFDYGGGENSMTSGRVQFTHVPESVFAAILQVHPNGVPQDDAASQQLSDTHKNNAASWGGFQYLYQPQYGCHLVVPKVRHRRPVHRKRA